MPSFQMVVWHFSDLIIKNFVYSKIVSTLCCYFGPVRLQPTDILHRTICYGYVSRLDQFLTKRCHHVSQVCTLSWGPGSSRRFGLQKVPYLQLKQLWMMYNQTSFLLLFSISRILMNYLCLRLRQSAVQWFIICSPSPGQTTREAFQLQETSTPRCVRPHPIFPWDVFEQGIHQTCWISLH